MPAERAAAAWPFDATLPTQVSLAKGDVVTIIKRVDDAWAKVEKDDGTQGLVPSAYIKVVAGTPTPSPASPTPGDAAQAAAAWPFDATLPTQVSLAKGDIVTIIERVDDAWAKVEKGDGTQGLVPSAYIKEIIGLSEVRAIVPHCTPSPCRRSFSVCLHTVSRPLLCSLLCSLLTCNKRSLSDVL